MNNKVLLFTICICLLSGCATRGIQNPTGTEVIDVMPVFLNGDARLNCDTACSGSWGASRKTAKGLHEQKLWKDLATEVARVGYRSDLAYFYLGQAAEGLSNIESARIYYKLGLVSTKCDSPLINNCDGFVFPKDILDAMNRLPSPPNKANQTDVERTSNLVDPTENSTIVKKMPDESQPAQISKPSAKIETPQVESDSPSNQQRENPKSHQEKQLRNGDKRKSQDQETEKGLEQEKEVYQQSNADVEASSKTKTIAMIRKATKQERSLIISAVNKTLFDSESARYREVYLIPNSLACVEVNAKNRFGGYTGFQNVVVAYVEGFWFSLDPLKNSPLSCFDLIAEMHMTRK